MRSRIRKRIKSKSRRRTVAAPPVDLALNPALHPNPNPVLTAAESRSVI
jgi:hypothetical protein